MKQFFFSFPREDLRKWLSYVCRSRDHSLSHTINFTLSRRRRCSLTAAAHHFSRSHKLHWMFLFFSSFLPLSINTGTNSFLFCLIVYILLVFFNVAFGGWKMWLSNHLLQNFQFKSIANRSTATIVVVEVSSNSDRRRRHTLEGCRRNSSSPRDFACLLLLLLADSGISTTLLHHLPQSKQPARNFRSQRINTRDPALEGQDSVVPSIAIARTRRSSSSRRRFWWRAVFRRKTQTQLIDR